MSTAVNYSTATMRMTAKSSSSHPSKIRRTASVTATGILLCFYLSSSYCPSTTAASSTSSTRQSRSSHGFVQNGQQPDEFPWGENHPVDLLRGGSSSSSSSSSSASVDNNDDADDVSNKGGDHVATTDGQDAESAATLADRSTDSNTTDDDATGHDETTGQTEVERDDEDETTAVEVLDLEEAIQEATVLRLEGKHYHDDGDFNKAADLFRTAADTILRSYQSSLSKPSTSARVVEAEPDSQSENDPDPNERDEGEDLEGPEPLPEDYATCRLHQALCYLKSDEYEMCIEACSDVLQGEDNESNDDDKPNLNLSFSGRTSAAVSGGPFRFSPAVRARAYHRRAKAKSALGDVAGAVLDARTGAFLGYDKAVAFYGKLMRESSSQDFSSAMNPLFPSTDTSLLQSLLSKSSSNGGAPSSPFGGGMSPLSMLMGGNDGGGAANMLGALTSAVGGQGSGGFAGSMIRNLSKRLDDEDTQEAICAFLQRTTKEQLGNLASMTPMGAAADESIIDQIVNFCHSVTPRGIRRTVKVTKVMVYIVKFFRRLMKLINKYKSLLAVLLILQWSKSSLLRPIALSPAAKKAAKRATKQALNDALKKSR